MSLDRIEQEEEDRIQYEMQLAGQGGKKCKVWPSPNPGAPEKMKPGSVRVESSEDYRLIIKGVNAED